jgi:hypothetical protein
VNLNCRPNRFMAVYGIHLGGYLGGALGAVLAAILIRRQRREQPIQERHHETVQDFRH